MYIRWLGVSTALSCLLMIKLLLASSTTTKLYNNETKSLVKLLHVQSISNASICFNAHVVMTTTI